MVLDSDAESVLLPNGNILEENPLRSSRARTVRQS